MISIIICSIDNNKFSKVSQNYANLLRDEPFEIIGIHDASSLAEGYNRGIDQSSGSVLIFSHDDIEIVTPDFSKKLHSHLTRYDMVGVAGTSCLISALWMGAWQPFIHGVVVHPDPQTLGYVINVYGVEGLASENIQALDGLFVATTRRVVETMRFDELNFDGFHGYDIDFTFTAYRKGFRLAVASDITIIHNSNGSYNKAWQKYAEHFMQKHMGTLCTEKPAAERLACAPVSAKEKILDYCQIPALIDLTKRMRAP